MHQFDITMENLSKIEGHTDLDICVRNNKVKHVHLKISENKRFYTQAIRGKPAVNAPHLMCRICGTCSIAHLLCCIQAVENALGVEPSPQTVLLRKLAMYGLYIRDHALHCYMFSLPDVVGKDSILEFDETNKKEHDLIHDCFDVKAAGNALCTLVAGKAVHAPYPGVGGFTRIPAEDEIKPVIAKLLGVRNAVLNLIEIFMPEKFDFTRETQYVCLTNPDFNFYTGDHICTSKHVCIPLEKYGKYLEHHVMPYSQASGYKFKGQTYLVGALARVNLNEAYLHPSTRKDAKKALELFPSKNVFYNNLAQVIEMLHAIDASVELLKNTKFKPEQPIKVLPKAGKGVGVVEAPRGTLYYLVEVGKDGKVTHGDIVVPTGQNQINIEQDIKVLVEKHLGWPKEKLQAEIEKLIRAYDPCMSCAAHFLKLNWI
ncbi:nickel-dependent hydrogenase large subunit [Candidatus Woesearchaeota archaeon]|nr:nickel-dependent hydrogenase large subunit [Candidatus Woesearchaeota archaeon]